jgi:hypothetical protein
MPARGQESQRGNELQELRQRCRHGFRRPLHRVDQQRRRRPGEAAGQVFGAADAEHRGDAAEDLARRESLRHHDAGHTVMERGDPVHHHQREGGLADAGEAYQRDAPWDLRRRLGEQRDQLGDVGVTPEQVAGRRQPHEPGRHGRGRGGLPTRDEKKRLPVWTAQAQPRGEQLRRGPLGARPAPLEVAHRPHPDSRARGQLVLGQLGPNPVVAQHGVKSRTTLVRPVIRRHDLKLGTDVDAR